jgi:hypothetical protein
MNWEFGPLKSFFQEEEEEEEEEEEKRDFFFSLWNIQRV